MDIRMEAEAPCAVAEKKTPRKAKKAREQLGSVVFLSCSRGGLVRMAIRRTQAKFK